MFQKGSIFLDVSKISKNWRIKHWSKSYYDLTYIHICIVMGDGFK